MKRVKKLYWELLAGTTKRRLINSLKKSTEAFFKKIENSLLREHVELIYAPIFIIGSPRSGSTLLYQLMARHFKVCYFSNFMVNFPEGPACMAKFLSLINGCNSPAFFDSRYGETFGWRSPNQGIAIWFRWFPKDHSYVGSGVLSKKALREIRNTVALIQKYFNAPFVNKWQANTVRLLALSEALPEALFVRIKRNPIFIAQSILYGKKTLFQDERDWFSTRPSNYEKLKHKEPLEQACEQVFYIEEDIDRDSNIIGKDRFLTVHYEELCTSPMKIMNNIQSFYSRNQKSSGLKSRHEIPFSFPYDDSIKIGAEEFKAIGTYFSQKQKITEAEEAKA
jgi:hypothetical protein